MKIAIQGTLGSFHHIAAEHYYGSGHEFVCCDSFREVFEALADKRADAALTAIENSMYGSISEVYDFLQQYRFPIAGEVMEHIHQNLIGFNGTKLEEITKVYSHPVALAQCKLFLESSLPHAEAIEYADTASAVEHIKTVGDKTSAAIASQMAAETHNMAVLQPNIQDERLNYTRFLVLSPTGEVPADADKASLILTTSHRPGALHGALGVFTEMGCNLTKLQSRPIPGKVWQYEFYIDVEITSDQLGKAVEYLKAQECDVTVLGIYKAATVEFDD